MFLWAMSLEAFEKSLKEDEPAVADAALRALWWDAKGEWEMAHTLCQDAGSRDGDWVHAYLHRVEGDEGNARYWYSRCGKPFFDGSLEEEWKAIVTALLRQNSE